MILAWDKLPVTGAISQYAFIDEKSWASVGYFSIFYDFSFSLFGPGSSFWILNIKLFTLALSKTTAR